MNLQKELEEKMAFLKEKGVVVTAPRLIILEYLLQNRVHPTAEEVYQALIQRFPSLSLASIYNNLKLFSQLGIVMELVIDKDKARYDIDTKPHAHFKCLQCGRVYDLFDIKPPKIKKALGHKVFVAQLYLYGICQECSSK